MSPASRSGNWSLGLVFAIILAITLIVYLLRGLGILTFIPGGIIWILILLSIGMGIIYGIKKTRRF